LRFLLKLPLKKLTIWAGFLALLLLLRDFFPLILMTFVLSYIATTVVNRLEPRFSARWIPIVLFFSIVIAGVVGLVMVVRPQVQAEAKTILAEVEKQHGWNKWLDEKLRGGLGADRYDWADENFGEMIPMRSGTAGVSSLGAVNLQAVADTG